VTGFQAIGLRMLGGKEKKQLMDVIFHLLHFIRFLFMNIQKEI